MRNTRILKLHTAIFLLLFIGSAHFVFAREDDGNKNRDKILPDIQNLLQAGSTTTINIENKNRENNEENNRKKITEQSPAPTTTPATQYTATSIATSTSIYTDINSSTNTPTPQPEASPPISNRQDIGGVSATERAGNNEPKIIDTRKFDMWVKNFLPLNSYASGGFSESTTKILSVFAILSGLSGVAILFGSKVYV